MTLQYASSTRPLPPRTPGLWFCLHGWPDSVLRFQKVLPLLSDVHVIAPALPGYPFAARTSRMVRSCGRHGRKPSLTHWPISATAGMSSLRVTVGSDVAESLAATEDERRTTVMVGRVARRFAGFTAAVCAPRVAASSAE